MPQKKQQYLPRVSTLRAFVSSDNPPWQVGLVDAVVAGLGLYALSMAYILVMNMVTDDTYRFAEPTVHFFAAGAAVCAGIVGWWSTRRVQREYRYRSGQGTFWYTVLVIGAPAIMWWAQEGLANGYDMLSLSGLFGLAGRIVSVAPFTAVIGYRLLGFKN